MCSKWNICHKAVASGALHLPDGALPPLAEPKTEVSSSGGTMRVLGRRRWGAGARRGAAPRTLRRPCPPSLCPSSTHPPQIGKKFHLNTGLPYLKHTEPWWTFDTEDTEEEEEGGSQKGGKAAASKSGSSGDDDDGEAEEAGEEEGESPPARPDAADEEVETAVGSDGDGERPAADASATPADAEEAADDDEEPPAAEE